MIDNVLHKFPSFLERDRYLHLLSMERAGLITWLDRQPKFKIEEKFKRNGKAYRAEFYIADFEYKNSIDKWIIEDAKGIKTDLYKSKVKRFLNQYREYEFHEVYRDKKGFKVVVK